MAAIIRPATEHDTPYIAALVNRFAARNVMLPRTETSIAETIRDWIVACAPNAADAWQVVGCGALVPLTETLVELRSLAVDESQHGQGLGSKLVLELVEMARRRGYPQLCALTLREDFFVRLGFQLVDRWSISPKVWQACIYCPKFHRCDEVAVLITLNEESRAQESTDARSPAWNGLLKWNSWQPLRLAYQQKPTRNNRTESTEGEQLGDSNARFG